MPNKNVKRCQRIMDVITKYNLQALSDADVISAGNALIAVQNHVAKSDLIKEVDNMTDGNLVPLWDLIEAEEFNQGMLATACRAAVRLSRADPNYRPVNTRSPTMQYMLTIMRDNNIMSQAQVDVLTTLGDTEVRIWDHEGLSDITERDILLARE